MKSFIRCGLPVTCLGAVFALAQAATAATPLPANIQADRTTIVAKLAQVANATAKV